MTLFISGALGFGFGVAFLAECFRAVTMWWLSLGRKVG